MGNKDSNTDAVQEPGALYPHYDINLAGYSAGDWAFISFPVECLQININEVLDDLTQGDGQTTWDIAKWYDPLDANDTWKTYRFGAANNDLVTLDNTQGVWLHLTANSGDQMLTISGDYASVDVNVPLYTGWNLVSYPSATPRAASATLPAQADIVSYYDAGAPYLVTDDAALATVMSEGNAYWVHVTSDCVWSLAP